MNQTEHAKQIAQRFKDIYEQSGENFSDDHYDELLLLVEAGLDTALMQQLESIADKLSSMTHDMRQNAERFSAGSNY